ncbi:MAG: ferrous iron transport protein A [Gemmataceae bacterium]|nr:ferrous iron transport protein A [Gemmataceae bacterium]MDW8242190.1 FeoA family protein [Thermogemmata sp.]
MRPLNTFQVGQRGVIRRVDGPPALVQRLGEFGVLEGETIEVLGFAPLGDPMEVRVGASRLSLRKAEAAGVLVEPQLPPVS